MRKTAVVTLILIGLMTLGIVCIQPIKAEYQGDITINADGSISPSTATIQQTGNIYTLTSDVDGDITVEANNIVLDGKGYTLLGGVSLTHVSDVTVKGFVITNTAIALQAPMIGIALTNVTNAIVANNTITGIESILAWNGGTYAGIYVKGGNSNTITGNNLTNNLNGLDFLNTSNNSIIGNNIVGQQIFLDLYTTGIWFINSPNNRIYYNNFINSTYLVQVSGSINAWDDGYLGNYWSDYKTKYPSAVQMGGSGVYNIPYAIDAQNIDRYPLTQPFNSAFYAPKVPPKIATLSPVNQEFNESSVPLLFTVDKQVNWMGYSLDGQDNVTVTGNSTISELTNGLHNVTVYARDTFGNEGASETIAFTVSAPEAFPTAPVLAASAATLAIACIAILVYFKKRRATNLKRHNEV
jgi:parallel beta-helix repeat protein